MLVASMRDGCALPAMVDVRGITLEDNDGGPLHLGRSYTLLILNVPKPLEHSRKEPRATVRSEAMLPCPAFAPSRCLCTQVVLWLQQAFPMTFVPEFPDRFELYFQALGRPDTLYISMKPADGGQSSVRCPHYPSRTIALPPTRIPSRHLRGE